MMPDDLKGAWVEQAQAGAPTLLCALVVVDAPPGRESAGPRADTAAGGMAADGVAVAGAGAVAAVAVGGLAITQSRPIDHHHRHQVFDKGPAFGGLWQQRVRACCLALHSIRSPRRVPRVCDNAGTPTPGH